MIMNDKGERQREWKSTICGGRGIAWHPCVAIALNTSSNRQPGTQAARQLSVVKDKKSLANKETRRVRVWSILYANITKPIALRERADVTATSIVD